MTEQEKNWFEKLRKKRANFANELKDPDYKKIWNRLIYDIYSDKTHFIYELIQNAEDVKATTVEFILKEKGLYFKHNGNIHFTITDVDKPKENGHINALTAIGRTGKRISKTIGRFGIGFKSVFQYTKTPHILDPNFQFKIYDYIVPELLESFEIDIEYNKEHDTIFYFPFINNEEKSQNDRVKAKEEAYRDISEKLKNLDKPTLFLSNIKKIICKIDNDNVVVDYEKELVHETIANKELNIKYERIKLKPDNSEFLIFTRQFEEIINDDKLEFCYSVCFKIENNKLQPNDDSKAFCFFSTRERIKLNFLINAPFLLNSNRESIPKEEKLIIEDEHGIEKIIKEHFNEFLVGLLAELAADSLLILKELKLINDDIIKIIPYSEPSKDDLFRPFYDTIKVKLQTEEILPSNNGEYAKKDNAYWADSTELTNLFSNEQLTDLVNNQNAKWVFTTIGRTINKYITDYIDGGSDRSWDRKEPNLIKASMDFENKIADLITCNFINNQNNEWLHKFYEYLSERKSYQVRFKTKPIFKDTDGNAVAAFEQNGNEFHEILFLLSDNLNTSTKTILPELLENEKSKEFIESFGIKQPNLKDVIYNQILPEYNTNEGIDTKPHFMIFFEYYKECPTTELESYIDLIKDKAFVLYSTSNCDKTYRDKADNIYFPSDELIEYFKAKPDTKFLYKEFYYDNIEENDRENLKKFLDKIGVHFKIKVSKKEPSDLNYISYLHCHGYHKRGLNGFDKDIHIDGLKEALDNININISKFIWNKIVIPHYKCISGIIQESTRQDFINPIEGPVTYSENFGKLLIQKKWLYTKNNELVAPNEIKIDELHDGYDKESFQAKQLIELLKFQTSVEKSVAEIIAQIFESEDEAKQAKKLLEDWKAEQNTTNTKSNNDNDNDDNIKNHQETDNTITENTIKDLEALHKEIKQKTQKNIKNESPNPGFNENEEFAKGINNLKKQFEIKNNRDVLIKEMENYEKSEKRYSYEWFIAYLKLLNTYSEKQDAAKQKSLTFKEIKPYKTDNKFFLLCGASSYISPEIENAEDFKVTLVFKDGKKENITVEGVSKKGLDLLIYIPNESESKKISNFKSIFKVEINFTPVIDLLERLLNAFKNTENIDKWENIEKDMPALNYIYGPPGTGKTTAICYFIKNILDNNPNAKFLVLTPTNKAADVVCKKLLEINDYISTARLSHPTDPDLEEKSNIYKDTLTNEILNEMDVVATTIHRLPYYDIQNFGLLFKYKWDYVIFDESSMIGLHYITFAIMALKKTNSNIHFTIAGDPKQIPPIVEINDNELENFDFQDENIYKMMELESFDPDEQKIRKNIDAILNLKKQYRSIPEIGQLFSELSYKGLLGHDREDYRKESKPLPAKFKEIIPSNVTFIDIPLERDNSIYKVSKLFYSSYQNYCAILVLEIIKFFDKENNGKQDWTIGIIAPYKAQAVLINKLITSYSISENVKVFSDTVHGFQGDECDIVFFICNPNNYSFTNHPKCLLSKEYIYNVAISRAKDYLVIFHPQSKIKDNTSINTIHHSYKKNFGNSSFLETKVIENVLFNDEKYIEKNSYVSGHDNVNVFGLSEMKYFIKLNDTAIDIQLIDLKEHKTI